MSFLQISGDVTCCPHKLQFNDAGGRGEGGAREETSGEREGVRGQQIIERGRGED